MVTQYLCLYFFLFILNLGEKLSNCQVAITMETFT